MIAGKIAAIPADSTRTATHQHAAQMTSARSLRTRLSKSRFTIQRASNVLMQTNAPAINGIEFQRAAMTGLLLLIQIAEGKAIARSESVRNKLPFDSHARPLISMARLWTSCFHVDPIRNTSARKIAT